MNDQHKYIYLLNNDNIIIIKPASNLHKYCTRKCIYDKNDDIISCASVFMLTYLSFTLVWVVGV